jgi:hypothetical protein
MNQNRIPDDLQQTWVALLRIFNHALDRKIANLDKIDVIV